MRAMLVLLVLVAGCSFPRCVCECPEPSHAYLKHHPTAYAERACRDFCEWGCP